MKRNKLGRFVKGSISWCKGKKLGPLSEEHKQKISIANKGNRNTIEHNKKISIALKGREIIWKDKISKIIKRLYKEGKLKGWNKGMPRSKETKRKISIAKKGFPLWPNGMPEETKKLMRKNHADFSKEKNPFYGKHHSEETRKKMRIERSKQIFSEKTIKKLKIARAKRVLPIKDTSIEIKIQNFLKVLGIEFFTHQYIKQIKHAYQCDILIPLMNLVIECDGDYWHSYPTGTEIDHIRTKELIKKGFKVLRLWEFEIKEMNLNDFKNKLNIGG